MEQTWTYKKAERTAPIPAGVQLYVDLIGVDKTADLLLALGGSYVNSPQFRTGNGMLTEAIGNEAALAIGGAFFGGTFKLPAGKPFLIRYLFAKGINQQEIARRLHCDVSTVARNLNGTYNNRKKKP